MQVKPMRGTDFKSFERWVAKHGMNAELANPPGAGYIVPGVAIGFLLLTSDPKTVILDSIITNPHASSATRSKALNALMEELPKIAKKAGYKRILGYTIDDGIHSRACSHGFSPVPYTMLVKEL